MRNIGPVAPGATNYIKYTVGKNGIGNFTVNGVKAGDVILSVVQLGNPSIDNTITTSFASRIAADNTIAQLVATDYSAAGLEFLIAASGGGS